jgi:hypothetical protein
MDRTNYNNIPTPTAQFLLNGDAVNDYGTDWTATNVTWVDAEKGYVQEVGSFNGTTSYVNCWVNSNLNSLFNWWWTFSANINVNAITVNHRILDTNNTWTTWYLVYILDISWGFFRLWFSHKFSTTWWLWNTDRVLELWKNYHIEVIYDYSSTTNDPIFRIDWVIYTTNEVTAPVWTWWAWTWNWIIWADGTFWNNFNWEIGLLRTFDIELTTQESQNIRTEHNRLLWNTAKNPDLLNWLVWYIRAEDWWTVLYDMKNWTIPTYVWWSATTDNLWRNKAITNPNYTWTSITYTTGYTFENSWSWWSVVTSPTWLSATWINRTTTLRDVYLFDRTLSAWEITTLEALCNSTYPYPFGKSSTLNLQDWLVLHLDSAWNDLSGSWNSWTPTDVTKVRRNQSEGGSYNGSTSKIVATAPAFTWQWSWGMWVNKTTASWDEYLIDYSVTDSNVDRLVPCRILAWWQWRVFLRSQSWETTYRDSITAVNDWNPHHIITTINTSTDEINIYIDWVLDQWTQVWVIASTIDVLSSLYIWSTYTSSALYDWEIISPKIWNRVLSAKEVEQEFYLSYLN